MLVILELMSSGSIRDIGSTFPLPPRLLVGWRRHISTNIHTNLGKGKKKPTNYSHYVDKRVMVADKSFFKKINIFPINYIRIH